VLHVFPAVDRAASSWWYRDAGDGDGPGRVERFDSDTDGTVRRVVDEDGYAVDDADLAVVVHGGAWTVSADGGPAEPTVTGEPLRVGDAAELVVRRAD
jgi:hypothetical protein